MIGGLKSGIGSAWRLSAVRYIVTDVACLHVDALAELREAKIVLASGLPNYLVFRRR